MASGVPDGLSGTGSVGAVGGTTAFLIVGLDSSALIAASASLALRSASLRSSYLR